MTEQNNQSTDTTVGLVAYLTLIGFIVALVLNNDKKGETKAFGAFHLRQSLGLMIIAFAAMIAMIILVFIIALISPTLGLLLTTILYPLIYIGIFVLLIIGIINAANGKKKELPVVGPIINKMLGKAFE